LVGSSATTFCTAVTITGHTPSLLAPDSIVTINGFNLQNATVADLATVTFATLGGMGTQAQVTITSDLTPALAYDANLDRMELQIKEGLVRAGAVTTSVGNAPNVLHVWPNPASGNLFISLPNASSFSIFTAVG